MDIERRMRALRAIQRLLDSAFRIPGTRFRFGWDPIIGLMPWAGDVLTGFVACAIVVHAHQLRVPRVVQLRMLLNIVIDVVLGIVPFAGDVVDVFWKSNTRNMALIEQHAGRPRSATVGDWAFVTGVLTLVAAVAVLPLVVMYWLFNMLRGTGLA